MHTEPTVGAVQSTEDPAAASPSPETWLLVDGVMVIPASGQTITAGMVRRMIDEDRERHVSVLEDGR